MEVWFEHVWLQDRVDQLSLELFRLDSDFFSISLEKLEEQDPKDKQV